MQALTAQAASPRRFKRTAAFKDWRWKWPALEQIPPSFHAGKGRKPPLWFRRPELFDDDVFEPGFSFAAAVDLDGDLALLWDGGVRLGVVDGLDAVDPELNAGAFAADAIFVPVATLQSRFEFRHIGLCQNLVPARLVVKGAPPCGIADISLVSPHFVRRSVDANAPNLDTGVHESFRTDEFEFQPKLKVAEVLSVCGEEFILRNLLGQ